MWGKSYGINNSPSPRKQGGRQHQVPLELMCIRAVILFKYQH